MLLEAVVVIYGVIVAKLVFFFIAYKPFETGLIIKLSRVLVIKSVSGGKVIEVCVYTDILVFSFFSLI